MSNTDDIDKFGHCIICHKNLLTKRVVDGKVVDMFLPIYSDTMFLLSNGSQMQVTICKPCKESTDLNDSKIRKNIMEAIMKGWELETKLKVEEKDANFTEENRKKYLDYMDKITIDQHSEYLDKYVIQTRQMELLNKSVEDIKESIPQAEASNVIN